jgi:hypothetical protein
VTQAWITGAVRSPATRPGVSFTVRHRRAVWHTTETAAGTLDAVVKGYERTGSWPHATWDPSTGRVKQHYSAEIGARALRNPPGGIETNSLGALQVEVIGFARSPFTGGPMRGVTPILDWLRANGVPDHWPAGQPLAYGPDERRPGVVPAAYGLGNGTRKLSVWTQPGHFGHSQVPENDHGDPGRVDITFTEEDMPSAEEIAKAVWGANLPNRVSGEPSDAGTLLSYAHKHAYDLRSTLDDEAKLAALVKALPTAPAIAEAVAKRMPAGAVDIAQLTAAVADVLAARLEQ